MNILVTGGCGFIGSNFVRYVLKKHSRCRVVNLDKLTYAGNPDNLRDLAGDRRYRFVKGDICDKKIVDKLMAGVDWVVNFAAETHVDRSILHPDSFIQTDVYGTYVLLEAAKKYRVEKFCQISTDEIYGSTMDGRFDEESQIAPNSPYSASKAGGELLARAYFVTYQVPVVIVRASNNFGPYQYPEKLLPLFITNALENKPLPLYGDGKNVRDWLYVEDNCRAIELVLRRGKVGSVYNVGGGNEVANLEITKKILDILGKPAGLIRYVTDRPGHDRRYALNWQKISRELGWKPAYSLQGKKFDLALKKTVDWYVQNKSWWLRIKKSAYYRKFYSQQYAPADKLK